MKIRNGEKSKPAHVVYVQFRQARRNKQGQLAIVGSKTITISDAVIADVEALLRKSISENA